MTQTKQLPAINRGQYLRADVKAASVALHIDHSTRLKEWSGLFRRPIEQRQNQISRAFPELDLLPLETSELSTRTSDFMIENCIGSLGMPIGVAPTFVINDRHYVVPMAIEEASVIAAASGAAKLIASAGGFIAESTANVMTGQVQIVDVTDLPSACRTLMDQKQQLIDAANVHCLSMVKRGGGVVDVVARIVSTRKEVERFREFLVVHIHVDVCEAMGANVVNTICEGIVPELLARIGSGKAGLRILTNMCLERRTRSTFRIPTHLLSCKGFTGDEVAERIVDAFWFAESDPYRAATHNKGIMNGIDAVALATGQDWRAIESSAHSYACRNGYYGSLTSYRIEGSALVGTLEIPISVGTKGGALQTHPVYKFSQELLGRPTAQALAQIIVSVGLAQNFAALRALATEGIQRGHMSLHARNIAVAAGVAMNHVPDAAAHMVVQHQISIKAAKEYLGEHPEAAPEAAPGSPVAPVRFAYTIRQPPEGLLFDDVPRDSPECVD